MVNPFTPGFNRVPQVFPGREQVFSEFRRRLEYCGHTSFQPPFMLVGSRGMGKTVLLTMFSQYARERHWKVLANSSVHIPVLEDFASQLLPKKRFSEVDFTAGVSTVAKATISSTFHREQESFMDALTREFSSHAGVLMVVDEIHEYKKKQLEEFGSFLQKIAPSHPPLFVACAGLSSMRSPENRITYFERSNWVNIGVLDDFSALEVLRETSKDAGKPISISDCESLVAVCGNYPFALQTVGECVWECARDCATITYEHCIAGQEVAKQKLFEGFFSYRWPYYSSEKQHYLYTVAKILTERDVDYVSNSQIAQRLGLATSQLSKTRLALIYDGILQENPHKAMRLLFPALKEWIIQEME